jgi:type IX secretion system PorP/SprF family membrane protein
MKSFRIILSFLLLSLSMVYGQQENIFSQWCFNQNTYNPALAGIKNYQELKLLSRYQWVGFEGAPNSHLINYSTQIQNKRKEYLTPRHGLLLQFENDNIGAFGTNRISFGYAFHRNFTKDARLSVGIRGGLTQLFFDNTKLNPLQPDPSFNRNRTLYLPNLALGFWWNTDRYYAGLCIQQLAKTIWDKLGTSSSFNTHIIASTGTKFELSNTVTFLPNLLISKTFSNPTRVDAVGYFDFQNKFKIGLGLRNNESFLGLIQLRIKHQYIIGYTIDYISNGLNTSFLMSHELNFQYLGENKKDTDRLSCPMF